MANKSEAGNATGSADSNTAAFMSELMRKFGGPEEAMKAFAMFTVMMGQAKPSAVPTASTTAPPPTPTIPEVSATQPDVLQTTGELSTSTTDAAEGIETGGEADLADGVECATVGDLRSAFVVEGENPVVSGRIFDRETPFEVVSRGEGETPFESLVGETPVENLEGETPVFDGNAGEGETLENVVGDEAQEGEQLVEGETPIHIEGATPELSEKAEAPVIEEASKPADGEVQLVVDLTDVPEGTNSPINTRETRWQARRSLLDKIEENVLNPAATGVEKEDFPGPNDEEERRQVAERKRKGKHATSSSVKKAKSV